jgi:AcrR family transcriptional regulator
MRTAAPKKKIGDLPSATQSDNMSSKEKLLKSAEVLFARKGFREVSVREIAAHAGVNSALVGYYFRGKQTLFNEVFRSHSVPVTRERMRRLNAITEKNRKPSLKEVLEAWIVPFLRIGTKGRESAFFLHFTANLSDERWEKTKKISNLLQRTYKAFVGVLHQCLPQLSEETLMWRLHFVVGAMVLGVRVPGLLRAYSRWRCDPMDLDALEKQILPFAIRAFSAPEPQNPNGSKQKRKN